MNKYVLGAHLLGSNRVSVSAASVLIAYLVAIASAEAIGVFVGIVPGALLHALLIPMLLSHYVLVDQAPYRRILPILALAPLLRILSLTMPIPQVPQIYWYAMVGIPLLLGAILTVRLLDLSWASLGLHVPLWRPQIYVALSGLPLSVAAFVLLQPRPLIAEFTWRDVIVGSIILIIFTGFTEEIIFRGILQQVASEIFGSAGMVYSSILFAIMYIGSLSLIYVLFVGLVGLFFSWCYHRTGSIWGIVLAHSLVNVGMLFVWPFVDARLDHQFTSQISAIMQLGLWLLVAIGLGLCVLILLRYLSRSTLYLIRSRRLY